MIIQGTVKTLGMDADGLVEHDGEKYYVPYTAPGDVVEFEIIKEKRRTRIQLQQVISPSQVRVAPPCSHFGSCGGCKLQHVNEEFYLDFKMQQLTRALDFHGVIAEEIRPVHVIPEHKRRRISLTFAHRFEGMVLGYVRRQSKHIIDVQHCFLICPEVEALMPRLRAFLGELFPRRESGYVDIIASQTGLDVNVKTGYVKSLNLEQSELFTSFATENDLARLSLNYRSVITRREPTVKFSGVDVVVEAGKFLQASDEADEFMLACVEEYMPEKISYGLDLFSGRGTFTFLLAQKAPVDAFECEQDAINAMQNAAKKANVNLNVIKRDLFTYPLQVEELEKYNFIMVDPPRAGALAQVEEIGRSKLKDLVYISCSPASFARDAQVLLQHGFTLNSVTPLDQFLWSEHLEVIAKFSR
ncbi:class I SAM-dependent RNA methyltransferase [Candidatus Paracaedibacter symbiosus]|uniref:class I SAM-dependent RNA methyltransferase n=1 Tax=Candidatus Paracaedibacter symbiosus TaxID=244582 RepID=UPI0005097373|nr:methyltransferase [Candidatus Paracaedibacter symbiosus]